MLNLWRRGKNLSTLFASNALGTVLGQVVVLLTIPMQLHFLGAEQFGLVVLFNSFVAAGALTDLGIGPTVVRYIARTQHHPKALAHVFSTGFTVICLLSLAVGVIGVVVAALYPIISERTELVAGSVSHLMLGLLVVTTIGASMLTGLGLNVIKGLRLYRPFAIAESSLRVSVPVAGTVAASLTKDAGATMFAVCLTFVMAAFILLSWARNLVNAPNLLTTNLRYFRRKMLHFGRWVWVQAIFGFLGAQADRFIVAATMSLTALSAYAVAMGVANAMVAALQAGGGFLLPEASSRLSDKAWLAATYRRFTLVFSGLSALGVCVFLFLMVPVLRIWVGVEMATAVVPILLPLLWTVSSGASSVPGTQIMNAMGYTRFGALLGIANNSVLLVAMLIAGSVFGLTGVLGAKLLAVPIGYVARAVTARHVFDSKRPLLDAIGMIWPTVLGAVVVLPISWKLLT
ncbi:oligosaccharide flippase family protein [uncultured Aquabacterium sp.]|uniref:oligosaccharide flippase family protein n=1 Tax=uncultured Aquabacterium sp. TaxID=158753 RepID=UPI0025CF9B7F|nr:oligosaccharide flippase family protein [uncultured Aquabacterium sp.]